MGKEEHIFIDLPSVPREEQVKYEGMDVAIVDGKIVAAGANSVEAYEKARELFPDKSPEEIEIVYIPRRGLWILCQS
ncbi:MAG TPA: hypothetical protein EYP85_07635 [Armatimonadetes bacterium]|nr:hypothetical protein [Armatimonadota bacterium]